MGKYIKISDLTYIMTNITLSIKDETYKQMKEFSEIKWSEFVRKAIEQRLSELRTIQTQRESVFTMVASQDSLKKDWDNQYDERWNNV